MLEQLRTPASDTFPLQRIAGFTALQGNAKSLKVAEVMKRIRERPAMRMRIEE